MREAKPRLRNLEAKAAASVVSPVSFLPLPDQAITQPVTRVLSPWREHRDMRGAKDETGLHFVK